MIGKQNYILPLIQPLPEVLVHLYHQEDPV